ncbi:hypothetical protein PoB_002227200, partial [Plakobranchus ocellatus]
ENEENYGEKVTFEEYISHTLAPLGFRAYWLPGTNQFLYKSSSSELRMFNCSSNSSYLVMDNTTF